MTHLSQLKNTGELQGRRPGSKLRLLAGGKSPRTEEPRPSRIRFLRPARDIRMKILALVLLSALAPAFLVGVASYMTARKILNEKVTDQLAAQTLAATQKASLFLENRIADTRVFAGARVVSEYLDTWTASSAVGDASMSHIAKARIHQYLAQVQQRYPLYRALLVFDSEGTLISSTASEDEIERAASIGIAALTDTDISMTTSSPEPLLLVRHPVLSHREQAIGTLVTASGLQELWHDLDPRLDSRQVTLRVLDYDGSILWSSRAEPHNAPAKLTSEGALLSLGGGSGLAEYLDERGVGVLGSYRHLKPLGLGFLVEIGSKEAFAASQRLRDFNLLGSLLATVLISGIAFALVLNLTRPIDALIRGAQAASQGDLTLRIPVTSKDQIGFLTEVFNNMTLRLHESRAKLEKMSRTDELTGLANRHHLSAMFKTELSRSQRTGEPLSVLMIDLDHFKAFNDRFGHLRGDSLLREAGSYLELNLRPTDMAARFGGEEFLVLLPDTDKESAVALAERLRKGFEGFCCDADDDRSKVTISIGVASRPDNGNSKDDLLRAADAALYEAKRRGRNQVRVAV